MVLIAVFAIVVAPVFEEFFFRGFAYPVLKQRWGTLGALLVVSAVFAVIHFHLPSLGPLFALAVGLGLAYELTARCWPPSPCTRCSMPPMSPCSCTSAPTHETPAQKSPTVQTSASSA